MKRGFLIVLMFALIQTSCDRKVNKNEFYTWASTPPMGWNSWDCYGPTVTEAEVKANADYMAEHLKQHGWEYIVVDIRWYIENDKSHGYNEKDAIYVMDENGRLLPAENRFPSAAGGKGFKPLADYIHDKGLKFGIHIMRGIPKIAVEKNTPVLGSNVSAKDIYNTDTLCTWLGDMYTVDATKEGAQEYYNSLIDLYASWGVDFLKIDDLSRPYHQPEIEMIRKAIDRCGRPIVLSTSPGETPITKGAHVSTHANMWRIIDDFWDNWSQLNEHFALFEKWVPYMGPGHWPDGDMLPLGRIGIRAERGDNRMSLFTKDEQYTLMSLFAICRSPLMFGGNLPDNDPFTLELITNDEVLDILKYSTNNRLLVNTSDTKIWIADDSNSDDKYAAMFFVSDQQPIDESLALYSSELITYKQGEQSTDIKVQFGDSKKLFLVVSDGGDGSHWDHADWVEPVISGKNGTLKLTELPWTKATAGWGNVQLNKSIGEIPIVVEDVKYDEGIGTHSNSIIEFDIPEGYDTFTAKAGLDRECTGHPEGATVRFHIFTQYPAETGPKDAADISLSFDQLGLEGNFTVRDLWTKEDLGSYSDSISLNIRNHGARLIKISRSK